jgi:hypothetical protein
MKRVYSVLFVLLATAIVVSLGSTAAMANCPVPTFFGSIQNFPPNDYTVLYFGDTSGLSSNVVAHFWQTSAPANGNDEGYPSSYWFYGYPGQDYWYIYGNTGQGNTGCPVDNLTVSAHNTVSDTFLLLSVDEAVGSSGEFSFDFSKIGGANSYLYGGTSPRVRVQTSARNGNNVDITYAVQDATGSAYSAVVPGAITDVCVYEALSATAPSPHIAAGAWTLVACVGATGTTTDQPYVADCSDQTAPVKSRWLANRLTVDGQPASAVGPLVQIECDPTLADPDGKMKKLDRPKPPRVKGKKQRR